MDDLGIEPMDTVWERVFCFGEVLWDCFPDGKRRIGGAPFNVAAHLSRLGCEAHLISAVGSDVFGDEALAAMEAHELSVCRVTRQTDLPTGTVQVSLDDDGQPTYEIVQPVAWDHLESDDGLLAELGSEPLAFVFGSLACRSEQNTLLLERLLDALVPDSWVVFDVNLRPPFDDLGRVEALARRADWLKLNEHELAVLLGEAVQPEAREAALRELAARHGLSRITLTRGEDGAVMLAGDECYQVKGRRIDVVDTVGAGDAFLAAILEAAGQGRGKTDWPRALTRANALASFVASQAGAVPPYDPAKLLAPDD